MITQLYISMLNLAKKIKSAVYFKAFDKNCLFAAHFLTCFSNVVATLKGISQKLHLKIPIPDFTWILMCLVSFELWAQEYGHMSHL